MLKYDVAEQMWAGIRWPWAGLQTGLLIPFAVSVGQPSPKVRPAYIAHGRVQFRACESSHQGLV